MVLVSLFTLLLLVRIHISNSIRLEQEWDHHTSTVQTIPSVVMGDSDPISSRHPISLLSMLAKKSRKSRTEMELESEITQITSEILSLQGKQHVGAV